MTSLTLLENNRRNPDLPADAGAPRFLNSVAADVRRLTIPQRNKLEPYVGSYLRRRELLLSRALFI